jgi:hypothetical protein
VNGGDTIPPPAHARAANADVSESFRNARTALSQISTDLEALRRRAAVMVKSAKRRPAK